MNTTALLRITVWIVLLGGVQAFAQAQGQTEITNLQAEYQNTPLGIDVENPRFSWQMESPSGERGYYQTAYRIVVMNEEEKVVWDTQKRESDISLGITYEGSALQPTTRYTWIVSVWDQDNDITENSSWFETGLMNPDPSLAAWNGAEWIGGGDDDLVFYPHYLSVFKLNYQLQLDEASGSTQASFVLGGNDKRLMDKDLNLQGIENLQDESFISFELDISEVDGSEEGLAKFNIYRVGYASEDNQDVPFKSYDIPLRLVSKKNKYEPHHFHVKANFGLFEIYLGGEEQENKINVSDDSPSPFGGGGINLNPVGSGNNYISYPMVADIGFEVEAGQQALFSNVEVRNYRAPSNALFAEDLENSESYQGAFSAFTEQPNAGISVSEEGYTVSGGEDGTLILADLSRNAAPMLRTEFATDNKAIQKARLYATARGIYEMYLNGERVGESYFSPGLTQYNKTHMYQTYDVTALLEDGENALGAWLSEGWWSGNITFSGEHWNFFGDRQSLLSKLVITYEDGSEQTITSNPDDWKYFDNGPIRYSSFFQGEVYHAQLEENIEGWATTDYDDSQWEAAEVVPLEGTAYLETTTDRAGNTTTFDYDELSLIGQIGENPGIVKTLEAQSVEEVRPGVFVYDMGQNMVGFPQIKIENGNAGDTIIMRYAEVKYPELEEYGDNVGMIMLENIRAALAQDLWILKGGDEMIQPRFTFHGYRFVEITGIDEALALEDVKGKVISSIDELASHYETSNELVNKLWENISWSMRGNFLSIPTDTPARNERMGWSGDINVFSRASTYLGNIEPFMRRHMLAMRDIQREDGRFTDVAPVGGGFGGTLWGSAGIIVPWEVYQQFGDLALLNEHYDAMKDYVNFLASKQNPETGILNEGPLGDWLSPEGFKNDNTLLWTAYQVRDLEILAKTAELLGKEVEAEKFWQQYEERKAFFNQTYVDPETHKTIHSGHQGPTFGPPIPEDKKPKAGDLVDTQASYAIPLAFKVFNEEHQPYAAQYLAEAVKRENVDEKMVMRPEYSLMTGFIGTASLNEALSENGYDDVAYRLLQQTSYPSWLYSVINGATTIWERLNSYTVEEGFGGNNSMNSFNHYSFGAVAAWMYNYSLGIQRETPGFKTFILQPTPDPTGEMTWAKGYYDSMYGRIESEWRMEEGQLVYKARVPANSTATLYLPAGSVKTVEESGKRLKRAKGISDIKEEEGKIICKLASGSYEFVVER
ncbi:family 78 glycoside hydrolase catalytic domain [Catalinimonas sp. 4WD22]|uniref:family 78 glycoside hydrolase catalytic domain n=1 Tax=Catalinimonas locisalis TaxID=3133978 RepID=UPI0031013ABF